ncbi:MAG: hypothetical protein Q8P68_03080 [Candidatus Peregrinibacteria bacterium]|nr:hypothetical protein [Candidatus Peregrinibacteria bacterium]MDZ4244717.1 hypothetical protein [Candidatus Gracilibacteria bacterium]
MALDESNYSEDARRSNHSEDARPSSALAGMLMFAAIAGTPGCNDEDLYALPDAPEPWTKSCFDVNGEIANPWGSEGFRHAMHRIVQDDADELGEIVTAEELLARECLLSQAALLTSQERCSGNPDMPAVTGVSVSNPLFGLDATGGVTRDEFGNPLGYSSGEDCIYDATLPVTISTNFGDGDVSIILSLMDGAGNIDPNTGKLISLDDDGSKSFAGDYPPDEIFLDNNGNRITAAPWFGERIDMIDGNGDRSRAVLEWCVQPDGRTTPILAGFANNSDCVTPPRNSDDSVEEKAI